MSATSDPPDASRPRLSFDPSEAQQEREQQLQPVVKAAKQTTKEQDDKTQDTLRKQKQRRVAKALKEDNIVSVGRPKAKPPLVLSRPDVETAVDALAEERKISGRHAKAMLLVPEVQQKRFKGERNRALYDQQVGEAEWLKVYDAYATTGVPATLARMTELPIELVEHLVHSGVQRLNLPPIKDHASRTDVMHTALTKSASQPLIDQSKTNATGLVEPHVEQAITTRAIKESAAAQQCLDSAIDANEIFAGFVAKMLEAVRKGAIEIGEPVKMSHLETMSKALNANTQALERAVKLSRLVRGETTDLVGAQIAVLLQACSTEELEDAERRGSLPSRLLNRFAGGSSETGPLVIDVPPEPGDTDGRQGQEATQAELRRDTDAGTEADGDDGDPSAEDP